MRNVVGIRRFEKRQAKGAPFYPAFMMISLTNACNLSCRGCWITQTRPAKQLSMKQLDGIIEASKRNGSYFFGILGGEPLLYPGLFDLFAKHKDCYFQLFTNGTVLTVEVAAKLKKVRNVTPMISIEGLENESDRRRGRKEVFRKTVDGLDNCVRQGLITGVAASICKSNFDELVSRDYLEFLAAKGAHYLWYYIYRPVGADPEPANALSEEQILNLRRFIVEQRRNSPIIIIDAYWDADGKAVCPGAMGMSHHIGPSGAVEFCPPLQLAKDFLNDDASNLEDICNNSDFLKDLRKLTAEASRGCILLENPSLLKRFAEEHQAVDSGNRDAFFAELDKMNTLPGHHISGKEIPDTNTFYRIAKKKFFFGFGAYG
jgi:MoaA/NifB/PqqE/SkfB family radical SAM enzyme